MIQKRRTLSEQIKWLILIPVMMGVVMAGMGYMMLEEYHDQVSEREKIISDIYLSQTDAKFDQINTSVRSMLYNREEIGRITEAYQVSMEQLSSEERVSCVLVQNNSVTELKNTFAELMTTYGNKFNFFYYEKKSKVAVGYGGCIYEVRKRFEGTLTEMIEAGTLSYTSGGRWFLIDDCICTVYEGPNGIGCAWMWADDFASNMCVMSPRECFGVELYDEQAKRWFVYEKRENGTLELTGKQPAEVLAYRMAHADFACRFIVNTAEYERTMLFPMFFFALTILYFVIASGTLFYARKNITAHAKEFVSKLKSADGEFNENSGLVEFAEAGKVLNRQSGEIRQLQIDIYEEQLRRQRVELDYVQLQIRPHFYINCLNIIHSMAQEGMMQEIQRFTVYISTYFRYIFKKGMEPVTVEKEIAFTENYLKILECMNDRNYRCRVSCEDAVGQALIPPLVIQTFVENAVKYNVDMEESLFIEVEARRQKEIGCVEIVIMDNGCGIDSQARERYNQGIFDESDNTRHVGIRNTAARLRLMYQERAALLFAENHGGGARVVIRIPFL